MEQLVVTLARELNLDPKVDIFLPHRDIGDIGVHGKGRVEVFDSDLMYLDRAHVVIALLDGPDIDSGTAVEMGYAFAKGKPVFGLLTDRRHWNLPRTEVESINNMIWGVCGHGTKIYRRVDQKLIENLKKILVNKERSKNSLE